MRLLKTLNVLWITMILMIINNEIEWSAASNSNGNSEDSIGFVIHLSTQELLKKEIMAELDSKLDQRLEKALEAQRNKFMQEIDFKLEQKLEKVLEKLHLRSENESQFQSRQLQDINVKLDQKLEKVFEKLNGIEQDSTYKHGKLLQEMKQLFEKQPHTNYEQFEKFKQTLEKQQNINKEMLQSIKESLTKQQQTHVNHTLNKISSQCVSKEKRSRSCAEVMLLYESNTSGIYDLYLPGMKPFEAYCLTDPGNGTAWTIIQRRKDNSIDFYLSWNEYKSGFGNLDTNFFLGLDKIHAMTQAQPHELWIEMEDFEGEKRFAKYDAFAIGDEEEKYKLRLGTFSGNGNDSLAIHNGNKFSTKDVDNDLAATGNCAIWYTGAWWHAKCHDSNLNGLYLNGNTSIADKGKGIVWHKWHGSQYSLKYVHMAIRPKS